MPAHVAVIGGGIAGLATAYELHRQHIPFTLIEARPRAGGVVFSEPVDGFVLDAGPDGLLVHKPEGIRLCEELGLGDRLVPTTPPRQAFIQRNGHLYPLPAASVLGIPTAWGPFVGTGLFSWRGKLRMALELFTRPRPAASPDADESIGSFMARHFGREAVDYLAEPLLAGIHAGDVDRLSLRALFPRFLDAERSDGSLLRAFRRAAPASPAGSGGASGGATGTLSAHPGGATGSRHSAADGAFRSLPGGLSEIIDALVAALPAGRIQLGIPVADIGRDGDRYQVTTANGDRLSADAVVLATPAFVTARIIRGLDSGLADRCAEIPYASAATVSLAFAREAVSHPLRGSGFVVPRVERTGILAGTWLSSKWPNRAPADRVLMRTFLGGARDPDALSLSDAEMVQRSLAALTPLLGLTRPPLFTRVYRWERANAQHEVGHHVRVRAIEQKLTAHPGIYLTGSGYRGVGIPDCVADARTTARQVAAWLNPGN